MIEVALPRTISLNERCTLLSHAICQIALLPPTGFSPLSLSLVRTHPSRQFVFISPSNNSASPSTAHFHMQPTTNPFERVQSLFWTIDLPCFAQGNVPARDL